MNKKSFTGGAGYIGSHTAVELIKAGYKVLVADISATAAR
jgi:UDP-glucose 4-epimerase